jgi:hypothetical protein
LKTIDLSPKLEEELVPEEPKTLIAPKVPTPAVIKKPPVMETVVEKPVVAEEKEEEGKIESPAVVAPVVSNDTNDAPAPTEDSKPTGYGAAPVVSMDCCMRGMRSPAAAAPEPVQLQDPPAPSQRPSTQTPVHVPSTEGPKTAAAVNRRLTFGDTTEAPSTTAARRTSLRSNSSGDGSPVKKTSSHAGDSVSGTAKRKINLF